VNHQILMKLDVQIRILILEGEHAAEKSLWKFSTVKGCCIENYFLSTT